MFCPTKQLSLLLLWHTSSSIASFVSDPDHCKGQIIDCIECDSLYDSRCDDPFDINQVRRGIIQSVRCVGVCSKWVHKYSDGSSRIRRTCSKNLELRKVSPYLVCIDESRRNGQLCFCDERNCNTASALSSCSGLRWTLTAMYFIIFIIFA